MKALFAAIVMGLALTPLASAQISAPLKPYDPAIIRVVGRAELYLPPDHARVRVSYYAPGKTAGEASDAVSARARALDAAIKAIDPEKTKLERTIFSVQPVMKEGGSRKPDKINGYQATADVTIRVRDLALLSKTVEAAVNSNPDTFGGVDFFVDDTIAARRKTRKAAIEDAVDKARIYSEGAGYRLGRLLQVEEGGDNVIAQTGNRGLREEAAASGVLNNGFAPPPIAPEAQLYTATVTIVFEVGARLAP